MKQADRDAPLGDEALESGSVGERFVEVGGLKLPVSSANERTVSDVTVNSRLAVWPTFTSKRYASSQSNTPLARSSSIWSSV